MFIRNTIDINILPRYVYDIVHVFQKTRSSATAEGPHYVLC